MKVFFYSLILDNGVLQAITNIFNFELTKENMQKNDVLNENHYVDPDNDKLHF